jgi:hypothetical protein
MILKRILTLAAASAAALGIALAVPAGAVTHPHATTVCGPVCVDVSGELLGPSMILNASNVGGTGPFRGRILNLRAGSNSAPNEDFKVRVAGLLHQFCSASGGNGRVASSSYACLTLLPLTPSAPVFELQFAPNSIESGYCAGALAAIADYKLRLRLCGTVKSYFIEDLPDADVDGPNTYVPLIFAADARGTNPLVVTATEFTSHPAHQVRLRRLNLTASDGVVAAQGVLRPPTAGPFS